MRAFALLAALASVIVAGCMGYEPNPAGYLEHRGTAQFAPSTTPGAASTTTTSSTSVPPTTTVTTTTSSSATTTLSRPPAQILVAETDGGTQVSEDGSEDAFTIRLNQAPRSLVQLAFTYDETELRSSHASSTFGPGNWSVPVTVTVWGVHDEQVDGDRRTSFAIAASLESDMDFAGVRATVNVITIDIDRPGDAWCSQPFPPPVKDRPGEAKRAAGEAAGETADPVMSEVPDSLSSEPVPPQRCLEDPHTETEDPTSLVPAVAGPPSVGGAALMLGLLVSAAAIVLARRGPDPTG